ncbi:MAG TPA: sec-independent translocase [Aeromicrobium sp.]|nr:sec-independent translocase [Aeromicrobium sp.]
MFGMGLPEIGVILVVGLLVFGPDKLPDLARQAGQFVRTVRKMADNAKADLGRELGQDLSGLDLKSLDPREVVRRSLLEDSPATAAPPPTGLQKPRELAPGQIPPFDPEAT